MAGAARHGDHRFTIRSSLFSSERRIGLAVFPPLSHSGRGLWFAGGPLDLEPGPAGLSSHGQRIELHALFGTIDGNGLALRWGGWLRT